MKTTTKANTLFALSICMLSWLSCQSESQADNQIINTFKGAEQKVSAKTSVNHLQFDKPAHMHRLATHSKQDLTFDQGF